MVRGASNRAILRGDAYDVGAARTILVDAAKKGVVFIELHDGAHSAVLELPTTPVLDDASGVVVARIDSVGRYGVTKVADTAALEAAARHDAGAASIVVLRVADNIAVAQVIAMTTALGRAGIGHVVLGLVPADVVPPSDGWESCPFPAAADDVNGGVVTLSLDWDDQGRPGMVRVVDSSGHGFGGAAVLCALWQRNISTSQCSGALPCSQKVRVRFKRDSP